MKQKKSMKWALSLVGATALLAGCGAAGSTTENTESDKLQVVTTFYPMYDFTKQVAQDDAEVSMLLEAGMEVHSFEPSSQMIAEIQDADDVRIADRGGGASGRIRQSGGGVVRAGAAPLHRGA